VSEPAWGRRPDIRPTLYGKFLAVSNCEAPVRIAVIGDTIEGARALFADEAAKWDRLLSDEPDEATPPPAIMRTTEAAYERWKERRARRARGRTHASEETPAEPTPAHSEP
jgi:hypothetical protein